MGGGGLQDAKSGPAEHPGAVGDTSPWAQGGMVTVSLFPPFPKSLQRPVHHVVPPSAVTEDYLRSFRPYHTAEELRMSSLPPLGLDPATAAAYYHPGYLTHHPFPHPAFRWASPGRVRGAGGSALGAGEVGAGSRVDG